MYVFTEEWLEQVRRRYTGLLEHQKPAIYHLATSSKAEPVRDEIEEWISDLKLSPEGQNKLVANLRSNEHFIHVYHELAAGHLLRQCGYQVEYEKLIGNLTPDWFVHSTRGIPAFVVEMFTDNPSDSDNKMWKHLDDLYGWLQRIRIGATVRIELDPLCILDQQRNIEIAHQVERWLKKDTPQIGIAPLDLGDIRFTIISGIRYSRLVCVGPGISHMVDNKPLREKIEKKLNKYRMLVAQTDLSLVIGVAGTFMTGRGEDNLADILTGQEAIKWNYSDSANITPDVRLTRLNDGLFNNMPEVSAGLWISKTSLVWGMTAIHNPFAVKPLPAHAFGK